MGNPIIHPSGRSAGLSDAESAEALNVSIGAIRRDWSLAEAWLFRELKRQESRDDA